MKFSRLVEHVSKKSIADHVKHLVVEVMVSDEEGEDVEVSHSRYFLLAILTLCRFPSLLFASNNIKALPKRLTRLIVTCT